MIINYKLKLHLKFLNPDLGQGYFAILCYQHKALADLRYVRFTYRCIILQRYSRTLLQTSLYKQNKKRKEKEKHRNQTWKHSILYVLQGTAADPGEKWEDKKQGSQNVARIVSERGQIWKGIIAEGLDVMWDVKRKVLTRHKNLNKRLLGREKWL